MAKQELRVSFKAAPAIHLRQLFGEAKHADVIIQSLTYWEGQAHEQEIYHYLNTDSEGDFVTVKGADGKFTVAVTFQNLRKQLSTMVMTGQIKRFGGERSARYALLDHEGVAPDEEEEVEAEDENGEGDAE